MWCAGPNKLLWYSSQAEQHCPVEIYRVRYSYVGNFTVPSSHVKTKPKNPCHVSYLFLCNILPHNYSSYNNRHVLSPSFCGSGTQEQLSWRLGFRASHKVAVKLVFKTTGSMSNLTCGCGQEASGPYLSQPPKHTKCMGVLPKVGPLLPFIVCLYQSRVHVSPRGHGLAGPTQL